MMAFIATPINRLPSTLPSTSSRNNVSRRCKPSPAPTTPHFTFQSARMSASEGDSPEETVSLQDLKARLSQPESEQLETEQPTATKNKGDTRTEEQKEIDRLRAAEKFIQIDEGKFECTGCGFVYEPSKGDPRSEIPVGTAFEDISDSYTCFQCRTPKRRFVSVKKVIAGFADNQSYGFGSNTMTGGQKSLLIFGGLAFCFLLLLSGYAMN